MNRKEKLDLVDKLKQIEEHEMLQVYTMLVWNEINHSSNENGVWFLDDDVPDNILYGISKFVNTCLENNKKFRQLPAEFMTDKYKQL